MRVSRENALGVMRWLGVAPGRVELPADVVIVSPHLDDAVFSLGGGIARAARRSRVTVLTVLAGDPGSEEQPGPWDARAGFPSAGAAARARREEDARACKLLGAEPRWLDFGDHQYARGGSEDEVRAAVEAAVGDRPVLLPGFPLRHEDHRWLHDLLAPSFPDAGLYTEQPYGAAHSDRPGVSAEPTAHDAPHSDAWRFLRAGLQDRRAKLRAGAAYTSQLELLGPRVLREVARYELRVGGEAIVPARR